jgi:hypothetical protein
MPQPIITTVGKKMAKFVKYIFSARKELTGIWFLRYRNRHLPITLIGGGNYIDNIALANLLLLNRLQPTTKTHKIATTDG